MEPPTYWNGEPCHARRVRVIVGDAPRPTWWCAHLIGEQREAVEVHYHGAIFSLDNADGQGWEKVTGGRGSPGVAHRALPVARVLPGERSR
jgi:hypothetical protein